MRIVALITACLIVLACTFGGGFYVGSIYKKDLVAREYRGLMDDLMSSLVDTNYRLQKCNEYIIQYFHGGGFNAEAHKDNNTL